MAGAFDDYNSRGMTVNSSGSGTRPCRGFSPGDALSGSFRPEGSKSLAQRILVAASLAEGDTLIAELPSAADVTAARALLEACGVAVSDGKGGVTVGGRPPAAVGWNPTGPLSPGESATMGRFAAAVLALGVPKDRHVQLVPEGTLRRRQSVSLFRALAGAGVGCEFEGVEGGYAVRLRSAEPPADVFLEDPASSQEVSALLAALAAREGRYHLHVRGDIPSMPYAEMSARVLESFGARVQLWNNSEGVLISIEGPLTAPAEAIAVEPDASTAGTALAAACVTGGELEIPGLGEGSLQGDVRIVELLKAFGCEAGCEEGRLWAKGKPTQGAEIDLSREPDLAPAMVAVAACAALDAESESRLRGLHTLPGKESNRIRVLARGVRAIGLSAEAGADFLEIGPPRHGADPAEEPPIVLDPEGDHRMAFAFALLGLIYPGIHVADADCVAKSWPTFWTDLEGLGASLTTLGGSA